MSAITMNKMKRKMTVEEIIAAEDEAERLHTARVLARKEAHEKKKAQRAEMKKAKEEAKEAKRIAKEPARRIRQALNEPPIRSTLEEVGNAISHGLGSLFGITALILMLVHANSGAKVASALVYGLCLTVLFTISCLYHSFRWGSRVKRVFRRFDYSSIYLLIGGTFAPIFLVFWGNTLGLWLFITQWIIIVTGVTLICVFGPSRFRKVHMILYVVIGWSGLMFLPQMIKNTPPLFWYTLSGGVIYTLGIIPFALKVKGSHFIWHFFVLFGAIAQWLGIYQFIFL